MVRMIPPYIHSDIKSNAEKKMFKVIKNELRGNWTCLHSLGLSRHEKKVEGEIDFLLVGDKGIFCLEVKGGRIERKGGIWKYINRYGIESINYEGPFNQASSAMYSLMNELQGRYKDLKNILFGYGVVFPDIEFRIKSSEWSNQIIYDERNGKGSFSEYLNGLIDYWQGKTSYKRPLSPNQISEVIKYLRGDFELVQPITSKLNDLEQKQIRLTETQYKALDRLRNNDRILLQGTAGTGKTLLAVEKARREDINGSKVLYLCFNKLLGTKINCEFMNEKLNITANSIHGYFYDTIINSGYKNEFMLKTKEFNGNGKSDYYKSVFPEYFVHAFSEMGAKFDYLIIDEGQDLLNFGWMSALDNVITGGLEKGNWAIFYDSNNQGEMYKNYDQSMVDYLKSCGAVEYMLDVNCRNTEPICIQTSLISGFNLENSLVKEGKKVRYEFFSNAMNQIKSVTSTINILLSDGVNPNDITILVPNIESMQHIRRLRTNCSIAKLTTINICNPQKNTIYYTTAQSFKGLENHIIIYFGLTSIEGSWIDTVNYVAMSRARSLLYVFLHQSLSETVKNKTKDYLIREALNK